jgi:putative transposase
MTEDRLVLAELLEKASEGDFLRAVAEAVRQLLMETDVEGLIGAGRYERRGERTTWRTVTATAPSIRVSARRSCAS